MIPEAKSPAPREGRRAQHNDQPGGRINSLNNGSPAHRQAQQAWRLWDMSRSVGGDVQFIVCPHAGAWGLVLHRRGRVLDILPATTRAEATRASRALTKGGLTGIVVDQEQALIDGGVL